ncbi:MAG TPA: site-specific integrase [Pirellulales bacterium]|nr:site-specific integrase [Pirellulales bacterium]
MAGVDGVDPTTPVVLLLDKFLDFAARHNAPSTFEFYKRFIVSFGNHIGKSLRVGRLKPHHVTDWLDENSWDETTRGCAIRAVKRPIQWAVDEGYITASPVKAVKRIKGKRRETIISPEQWGEILSASDATFRDFLTFIRETGARPQEARKVEARHFDEKNARLMLSADESKGKIARTIYLTETALKLVKRLVQKYPTGPLLRNSRGAPWTKNAVVCRFRRIREKTGLDGLVCYSTRHTFGTELLVNGVDSLVGAELMGHVDKTMLAETYSHLAKNPQFLRDAQRKARGG